MAATAAGLKARYPEFASVADATVTIWIGDAARFVDTTWRADDIDRATYALAAHYMASGGALSGAVSLPGPITSMKLGDAAETYGSWGGSMSTSEFSTTTYGVAFLRMLRANHPAVAIV